MQITSLAKKKKSLNAFLVQSPCAYNHSVNVYTVDSTRGGCEWRTLVQQNAVCDQRAGGRPPWLLMQIGIDQAAGRAAEVMFKLRSSN